MSVTRTTRTARVDKRSRTNGGTGRERARRATLFCFTLNNYTPEEYESITAHPERYYKWIVFGEEVGAEGTPHLQGAFSIIAGQATYDQIHAKYPGMQRASFQVCKGSAQQNYDYCAKGEMSHERYEELKKTHDRIDIVSDPDYGKNAKVFSYGNINLGGQGKNTPINKIAERLLAGEQLWELKKDPEVNSAIIQYPQGIKFFMSIHEPQPKVEPKVFWLYGPTASGKSHVAKEFALAHGLTAWSSIDPSLKWFDGSSRRDVVIFEEIRAKDVPFSYFLRLLDIYPMDVQDKGSIISWNPKYIFITTPYNVVETFHTREIHRPEDIKQLLSRLTIEVQFHPEDPDDGGKFLSSKRLLDTLAKWMKNDSFPKTQRAVDDVAPDFVDDYVPQDGVFDPIAFARVPSRRLPLPPLVRENAFSNDVIPDSVQEPIVKL